MKNLWLLFLVGLTTGYISENLLVSSETSTGSIDDLYLEGRTSGDLPVDDEDGLDDGSGSGSGDYEIHKTLFDFSQTTTPKSNPNPPTTSEDSQDQTTTPRTPPFIFPDGDGDKKVSGTEFDWFTDSPSPSTTRVSHSETTTESDMDDNVTKEKDEDNSVDRLDGRISKGREVVIEEVVDNELQAEKVGGEFSTSTEEVTSENLWERTEVLAAVIACGVVGFLCAVFLLLLLAYRMKKKDEGSYDLGDTKLSTTAYHKAPTKEFYA